MSNPGEFLRAASRDQRSAQVIGDAPADDSAGEQVDHSGQEQPALAGGDVGDVAGM
jgi:hypothetical protein